MVEHTMLAGTNQAVNKHNKAVPLLEVQNLKTHFMLQQGIVRAIDGVDFTIKWANGGLGRRERLWQVCVGGADLTHCAAPRPDCRG